MSSMSESFTNEGLPAEININEGVQVDEDGKEFLYKKDGIKCGGDFLPESPEVISLDSESLPPPPREENYVL